MNDILLAGATGLVGRALIPLLLDDLARRPGGATLHLLARRSIEAPAGTRVHRVDFAALPPLPRASAAYCALGTTIGQAGSQAAFRAVDHDAVLAFARAARAAGATHLAVVSALGADASSRIFYNRVKGETEAALRQLGFDTLVIARPSLLLGDRAALGQPPRPGERAGAVAAALAGALIPRSLRPIKAEVVARGMLVAMTSFPPGVHVVESGRLQALGAPR